MSPMSHAASHQVAGMDGGAQGSKIRTPGVDARSAVCGCEDLGSDLGCSSERAGRRVGRVRSESISKVWYGRIMPEVR